MLAFFCFVTFLFFQVEKEIGEKRVISFHGVGLSVAPAISFSKIAASGESSEEVGYTNTGLLLPGFYVFLLVVHSFFETTKVEFSTFQMSPKSWSETMSI